MKTEEKKSKSDVKLLKDIREKISYEMKNMNPEELKKYIDEKLKDHQQADSKNHSK